MRTTVDIDDDVLSAAKALAMRQGRSLGLVVSELVRRALPRSSVPASPSDRPIGLPLRGRFAMLPARHEVVTVEGVRRLMESGGA